MKAVVAAFNQEKALVGAFSVSTNLRMELFEALATPRLFHAAPTLLSVNKPILSVAHTTRAVATLLSGALCAFPFYDMFPFVTFCLDIYCLSFGP